MRLIDAGKLHYIRKWFDDSGKSEVVVFAKEIDKAPTVKAIPIEWIEKYIWNADTNEEKRALRKMYIFWEKEKKKMRLIDVDKFEEKNAKVWEQCGREDCYYSVGYILSQASVDAVPVIRCKDCKYREYGYCNLHLSFCYTTADMDYCSRAERKEE